jgi:hypothetical protein
VTGKWRTRVLEDERIVYGVYRLEMQENNWRARRRTSNLPAIPGYLFE